MFDILLVALRTLNRGRIYMAVADRSREGVADIVYADDILTLSATYEGLQRKAEAISGFMIAAGMHMSPNKFCGFSINWGNERMVMEQEISVYGEGWKAVKVPLSPDGCFKHLGVLWDMDLRNVGQFELLKQKLSSIIAHICTRKAAADTKWRVIYSSIFPMIGYHGQYMGWSLQQYRELDRILAQGLRRITKNQSGYPTALVFLPATLGGLGFSSLVDSIHKRKTNAIWNLYRAGLGAVADMLLGRYGDANDRTVITGMMTVFTSQRSDQVVWATSIIEWWDEIGVKIIHYGGNFKAKQYVCDSEDITSDDKESIIVQGTELMQELSRPQLVYMNALKFRETTVGLRRGQFWWMGLQSTRVFEILHEGNDDTSALVWQSDRAIEKGAILTFCGTVEDYPCCAGSVGKNIVVWSRQDMYRMLSTSLLLRTTKDRHTRRRDVATNACTVIEVQDIMCREWQLCGRIVEDTQLRVLYTTKLVRAFGYETLVSGTRLKYYIDRVAVGTKETGFRAWNLPEGACCRIRKNLHIHIRKFFEWYLHVTPEYVTSRRIPECLLKPDCDISWPLLQQATDGKYSYGLSNKMDFLKITWTLFMNFVKGII
jgi:hypothetical protein